MKLKLPPYKQELIDSLVKAIKAAGFRVFVAESGHYGFYTDTAGSRVVSFSTDLSTTFSGNYRTSSPRTTGTGWGLGGYEFDYQKMFDAYPPNWALGTASFKHTTLGDYMNTYQASSKFTEV